MKVLFLGSHLKHYYLAKWLREVGIETTLLLLSENKASNMPEWEDPSLKDNYPHWIKKHIIDRNTFFTKVARKITNLNFMPLWLAYYINRKTFKLPKPVLSIIDNHDVVFTSAKENILLALRIKKPVLFRAIGSDLAKLPFGCGNDFIELQSLYFRRNIRNVHSIINYQDDTHWASRFINVVDKTVNWSVPVDVKSWSQLIQPDKLEQLRIKYKQVDFLFFLPMRKHLNPNDPSYKGVEKLIKVFKRIMDENQCSFRILSISQGIHVKQLNEMIKSLGLEKQTDFLSSYLNLPNLLTTLSFEKTIVFNDLGYRKTFLTGIARECLAVGGILIDGIDKEASEFIDLYGASCPALEAVSEEQIYKAVKTVTSKKKEDLDKMRNDTKQWAEKYLHWESQIAQLISLLKKAKDSPSK